MADDVDSQEQIALPHLSQIALEARYLARGAGEQHPSPRTDCVANSLVNLPANGTLNVLRAHDVVEGRNILDYDMLDAAAAVDPGSTAHGTAVREYVARQKAEDAAAGRSFQQLARLSLGPANLESFIACALDKRGASRLASTTPDARVGIDDRAHEAEVIRLHGNASLRALGGTCATAATGIAELGYLYLVIRHSELLTKERQPRGEHLLLAGIEHKEPHSNREQNGVNATPAEKQLPSRDGCEGRAQ